MARGETMTNPVPSVRDIEYAIDGAIPAEAFTSEKAKSANAMKFDRPGTGAGPRGLKPLGNVKAPKAGATGKSPS